MIEIMEVVISHRGFPTRTEGLTSTQNTSCEVPGWMNHKPESRLLGDIAITSDMQMIPC